MTSTFVNDLRLNEMATGDQSGSWGTVTNTNLELIGEALGYGTEGITTNADTHTSTIADGATDPVRALYVEYTGTLDSACTVTIAPNTVNKVCFIENGTSGSQNIIIKQGSGATITIPPGDTKAVYLDGAGSGAKVVDAFASLSVVDLNVSGNLDVDGTANLDVVDIDGAVNMATTALVTGVLTTTAATVFNGGFASNDGSTITTADTDAHLTLISTDAGTGVAPLLVFNRNSSTPADNDQLGKIQFIGEDDGDNATIYSQIVNQIRDVTGGEEDGRMAFNIISAGADKSFINMTHDGAQAEVVINDESIDMDFRVESDSKSHMLFVDGGGNHVNIGTNSATTIGASNGGLNVFGNTDDAWVNVARFSANAGGPNLQFGKSRNATVGSQTVVADGDNLGQISFAGSDGTDLNNYAATIKAEVDGTPGGNDMPGRLVFSTTADGAAAVTERMRLDRDGNLLVGMTSASTNNDGAGIRADGLIHGKRTGVVANFNQKGNDGVVVEISNDNTVVGNIGVVGANIFISAASGVGLGIGGDNLFPTNAAGASTDDVLDIGDSSARFDDIHATNGTIQTSDRNEKQDIASLTSAEMLVAKRISALFKTFRWKNKVAAKGDNARTHTGIIAQDVQAAFTAESLDSGDYSLFISSTWWEHDVEVAAVEAADEVDAVYREVTDSDGMVTNELVTSAKEAVEAVDAYTRTDNYDTEDAAPSGSTSRTRLGIRYSELLSFVAAYNEQRFAAIETRLTALEG